jgi:ech hydrogenase subunit A
MQMVVVLIFLPIFAALGITLINSLKWQYTIVTITTLIISALSFYLFSFPVDITYMSTHFIDTFLIVADVVLLLFFVHQSKRFKNKKVLALALVQLLLYGFIETVLPNEEGILLHVNVLSNLMFLIINSVGGIIVIYALKYMHDEVMSDLKKRLFIAALLLFLSVMNTIVIANSLVLFFFLFEMTTLASYLLIAYRDDTLSRTNALRALWMNQIGGVAILLGILVAITQFDTAYLGLLMQQSGTYLLFAIALLSMAALVKGASLPFDSWLLGAMVAPTPVSAILHSATMVKIAPFMILSFAPVLAGTLLGSMLSMIGALVFVVASYRALSKDILKEILGYSTIALLGLMIALGAIGTPQSSLLVMVLILFHAISKALLFLVAGVIEKQYHVKSIEDMRGLVEIAPQSSWLLMLGFISLTLPPFGLFVGKLWAIEMLASLLHQSPHYLVVLIAILMGSVIMVLLYFKVASYLLANRSDVKNAVKENLPLGFSIPLYLLVALLGVSTTLFVINAHTLAILSLPLIILFGVGYGLRRLSHLDRSTVYHCGEKEAFDGAEYYFYIDALWQERLSLFFSLMFIGIGISGVLS